MLAFSLSPNIVGYVVHLPSVDVWDEVVLLLLFFFFFLLGRGASGSSDIAFPFLVINIQISQSLYYLQMNALVSRKRIISPFSILRDFCF